MAMVCTLSVFNGFQDTVADLFTVFDPELKVTIAEGKVFDAQDPRIQAIRQMPEVDVLKHLKRMRWYNIRTARRWPS